MRRNGYGNKRLLWSVWGHRGGQHSLTIKGRDGGAGLRQGMCKYVQSNRCSEEMLRATANAQPGTGKGQG